MTVRLSTPARDSFLGAKDQIGGKSVASFSSVSAITVSSASNAFVLGSNTQNFFTSGFAAGDYISVTSADNASNDVVADITQITSSGDKMLVNASLTSASSSNNVNMTISTVGGKSVKDMFKYHVLRVYAGTPPSDCDDTETGTLLLELTSSGNSVTAGTTTNGLSFASVSSGAISASSGQTITGTGLATGTAGYYRMYTNSKLTGAVTSTNPSKRIQGSVGTSNAQLILGTTQITKSVATTVTAHQIQMPASS